MNKPVSNRETIMLEALGDLRKMLEFAEEMGNVEFIDGADPELEIGALYEISLEEPSPPVLLNSARSPWAVLRLPSILLPSV